MYGVQEANICAKGARVYVKARTDFDPPWDGSSPVFRCRAQPPHKQAGLQATQRSISRKGTRGGRKNSTEKAAGKEGSRTGVCPGGRRARSARGKKETHLVPLGPALQPLAPLGSAALQERGLRLCYHHFPAPVAHGCGRVQGTATWGLAAEHPNRLRGRTNKKMFRTLDVRNHFSRTSPAPNGAAKGLLPSCSHGWGLG